jgi:hypothetical protein
METATSQLLKSVLTPRHARKSFVEAACIECGTIEEGPDFTIAKDRKY